MKRKYIIAGITCVFFIISGVCYSCAYNRGESAVLSSSKTEVNSSKELVAGENTAEQHSNQESKVTANQEFANEQSEDGTETVLTQEVKTEEPSIYVHICGAVVKPGVYLISRGARLINVVELCGGFSKDAAGDYINQAQVITDGQRIYIPSKTEVEDLSPDEYLTENTGTSEKTNDNSFVNINTADAATLMSLPGIGQAKAESIIEYRNTNGKFKTIEELMNISGIKEGLFHQISSKIIAQ